MTFILNLLIAFSIGFTGSPSQAPSEAPFKGLTEVIQAQRAQAPSLVACEEDMGCWDAHTMGNKQGTNEAPAPAPIQAPAPAPEVVTVSAPKVVTAAPKAPVQAPVQAKVTVQAPAPAPIQAPAPTVDPYSGNPIVDCAAQGLVRAEDYSCVAPSFYAPVKGFTPTAPVVIPPHAEPAPVRGKLCVDKLTIVGDPAPNECVAR